MLADRPELPSAASLEEERYWLTDLLHDSRDERGAPELRAIAGKLYPPVAQFVLKTRGQWLGSGKKCYRDSDAPSSSRVKGAEIPGLAG